ncbi:MAG: TlpA disulfide reductase family protein [Chloroflexi bacterium]|nr:TlpA disulfide reductase family protein [Chloroflexota bacterium]
MTRTRWNLLIALCLTIGLAWIWINRVPSGATATGTNLPSAPAVGYPAPDFTLTTVTGETFTLSALRGRPVVLNFWATWCPPCRAELPELQAASGRLAGRVQIVGVDQGESASQVQAFAGSLGLNFTMPLDTATTVSRLYGVRSLPTTFFIDRSGVIRQMQIGPVTEATLTQLLRTVYP